MTESYDLDDFEEKIDKDSIFDGTPIVPARDTNVLNRKPWVPFTIGDMRDGSNDYKSWPSKYFDTPEDLIKS